MHQSLQWCSSYSMPLDSQRTPALLECSHPQMTRPMADSIPSILLCCALRLFFSEYDLPILPLRCKLTTPVTLCGPHVPYKTPTRTLVYSLHTSQAEAGSCHWTKDFLH